MTWTTPRTWTNGELVNANYFNDIRDELLSTLDVVNGNGRSLNEKVFTGGVASFAGWGSNTATLFGRSFGIDWDALDAINPLAEYRVIFEYDVTTIAPGSPTDVTLIGGIQLLAIMGTAAAQGGQTFGSPTAHLPNTVHNASYDGGWHTIGANGQRIYDVVWSSNRAGGSGAGLVDVCPFVLFKAHA